MPTTTVGASLVKFSGVPGQASVATVPGAPPIVVSVPGAQVGDVILQIFVENANQDTTESTIEYQGCFETVVTVQDQLNWFCQFDGTAHTFTAVAVRGL